MTVLIIRDKLRGMAKNPALSPVGRTAAEAAQTGAGHWGVPLMVFQGEPFFGQDRIEDLTWRMRQHGLVERGG